VIRDAMKRKDKVALAPGGAGLLTGRQPRLIFSPGVTPLNPTAVKDDDDDYRRKICPYSRHRSNIRRYRRLLETQITELERRFVEQRLANERSALESLVGATFPLTFKLPAQAPLGGS
jgi:hypothetical protein